MKDVQGTARERLFVVWIGTVAVSAVAVLVILAVPPTPHQVLGVRASTLVLAFAVLSGLAAAITTFLWFWTAPKSAKKITVRELRRQAGYRR